MGSLYFLATFLYRRHFLLHKKRRASVREELAPIISNFLFHSHSDPIEEQRHFVELKIKIREQLRNKAFRAVLADILLDLQKDVSGSTRLRLVNLYRELELHNDSFSKLKSWRWETIAQGTLELKQMEVSESYSLIVKYSNDRRKTIRKQAEIAIVQLREEGIKHILDNARHPISEWQQLKLIEALSTHKNYNPPSFKFWLLSDNNDVVLFALRLIRHYNQRDAERAITELIKHKSDYIKLEALSCIKDFCFQSSLPTLKKIFWRVDTEVKIQILDTLAELGDRNDFLFLDEVKERTLNHLVKCKALGAMNKIEPDTVLPTKDIERFEGPKLPIESNKAIHDKYLDIAVNYEIENGDGISPIMRTEIEFTEIEIFEAVEEPIEVFEIIENDVQNENEEISPAFELNILDDSSNESLENHIGLVNTENTEGFDQGFDKEEFDQRYSTMLFDQREKLLDSIINYGDAREKQLLESIVDLEENSELRFRAFGKLKQLNDTVFKEVAIIKDKGQVLPESQHSIFHQLFDHVSDLDSQLLLLKEMAEVGDLKEIPFLKSLLKNDLAAILKTKVEDTIELIENKFLPSEVLDLEPLETTTDFSTKKEGNTKGKMPLELLLFNEKTGIVSSGGIIDIQPEFELAEVSSSIQEPSKIFEYE